MTTALFLLRATQIGISIRDLELVTIGTVMDMYTCLNNESYEGTGQTVYREATQADFDNF